MKHARIPRVRRVEYLLDFLKVVEQGYNRKLVEQKLGERKKIFEIEKNRALGRGRPFMDKLMRTQSLREDCRILSTRLGFARSKDKLRLGITENGKVFLNQNSAERRKLLAQGLLKTFTAFSHILLTIAHAPKVEVDLPMKKDNRFFSQKAADYGFEVGQTDFEVICDLASQLEITNWFPYNTDFGRYKRVYLVSAIYENAENVSENEKSVLNFNLDGRDYSIGATHVRKNRFKKTLWAEYLKATKYIPKRPVFYSQLRADVCYKLRISDRVFDEYVEEMMISDETYRLVGSGGSLPYRRDMASLLKSLPLKTRKGEYIVYLKMDTKQGV